MPPSNPRGLPVPPQHPLDLHSASSGSSAAAAVAASNKRKSTAAKENERPGTVARCCRPLLLPRLLPRLPLPPHFVCWTVTLVAVLVRSTTIGRQRKIGRTPPVRMRPLSPPPAHTACGPRII